MNFVGPFTLTYDLLPLLQANAPARCVNVVSAAFRMWKSDPFQDLQSARRFVSSDAYARAKLLNVLFSLALAKWVSAEQVTVNLIHPGMAWTPMTQSMTAQTIPGFRWCWPLLRLLQRCRSPEKAGRRVASLVASPLPSVRTGQYFEAKPTPKRLSGQELEPEYQRRAWQVGLGLLADATQPWIGLGLGLELPPRPGLAPAPRAAPNVQQPRQPFGVAPVGLDPIPGRRSSLDGATTTQPTPAAWSARASPNPVGPA
jgi:hypothetical protein